NAKLFSLLLKVSLLLSGTKTMRSGPPIGFTSRTSGRWVGGKMVVSRLWKAGINVLSDQKATSARALKPIPLQHAYDAKTLTCAFILKSHGLRSINSAKTPVIN